jgi:hypothetical protein
MLNRYEENEQRWYDVPMPDSPYPSMTTVGKCVANPALMPWAAKQAAEYMRNILTAISCGMITKKSLTSKTIDDLVKQAKSAHKEESKTAMDIGSAVHEWIEEYYKFKKPENIGKVFDVPREIQKPVDAFCAWDAENKVRPICVEERIWSKARFAGTLDLYAEVSGALTLLDFKSSKAHYPDSQVMQLGAYDMAFRERTGNKVEKYMVVRLDKTTGLPDPREYSREEVELGCKRFLAVLEYFWLTEQVKK